MASSANVISFYSFKGGTGRSTSLANVAHALAERGNKVGCMDLDVAAPGLHMIFPNIGRKHANSKQIHDHIEGYEGDIQDYIIDVGEALERNDIAELDGELLLIAGKIASPGSKNPFDMMQTALELREEFEDRRNLDYLLIDSRSGLSNHMFPIFHQADHFLAFHRWTHQHKDGTEELAGWLDDIGPELDNVMSVASNVSHSVDESDVEEWVRLKLYGVSDHHIINSSDILKEGEKVVALDHKDAPVVDQYERLADRLESL